MKTECPTDHAEIVSPTPEQELELARRALDEGDARHAAHHLAGVLGLDPVREGVDEAIDRWMDQTPDPLALVPVGEAMYVGTAALRAVALARLGQSAEAAVLMLVVQGWRPEAPYLDRVFPWLTASEAIAALPLDRFVSACSQCTLHPPLASALLPVLERVFAERDPHDALAFTLVRAARDSGDLDKAVAIAKRAEERAPSYQTAICRALAWGAKGDLDTSVAAYADAASRDPDDNAAFLDIGDIELDRGKREAAAAAYGTVLAREPEHAWALPSSLYLQWRYDGSGPALARLRALAGASPESRAAQLVRRADPYGSDLQAPSSSIISVIAHALEKGLTPTKVAVSSLEAPSCILAMELALKHRGLTSIPRVSFGEIPSPDPREPRADVDFILWTYKATGMRSLFGGRTMTARVAVPPPPNEIVEPIAAIARSKYDLASWRAQARELSATLGRGAGPEVAAAMVHPTPPARCPAWDWLFRTQVAAALVLAGIDDGWRSSARRAALLSLLYGPVDWTATAAVVAMVEIARTEPDHASDILAVLVEELTACSNPIRWSCIGLPLHTLLERLPIDDGLRERLAAERLTADAE